MEEEIHNYSTRRRTASGTVIVDDNIARLESDREYDVVEISQEYPSTE